MADHRNPGTSCHLITRSALSRETRGSWLDLASYGGSLGIFCASSILLVLRGGGPRGSGQTPSCPLLARPTTPRWLNTCPDLGISAGVAFNLLGGRTASRLGQRTSFCVLSVRMKPLPPPTASDGGVQWACGEKELGRPPGPPLPPSTQALGAQFIRMHRGVAQVLGWYVVQARYLIHRSELGMSTLASVAI